MERLYERMNPNQQNDPLPAFTGRDPLQASRIER